MRVLHTLMTMLLIFAVYIMDFTPTAILISEARAQEVQADAQTATTLNSTVGTNVSQSEQEKIDEANGTKEKSTQKTGASKNIDDENMLLNLTALAAAFVTSMMITECTPVALDMYIAAGGGALWVIGETMAAMKFKKAMSQLDKTFVDEYSTKREDVERQITALSLLKNSYMDAKDIIEAKIKMQNVAVIGYSAAAVTAFILGANWFDVQSKIPVKCVPIKAVQNKASSKTKLFALFNAFSGIFLKEAKAGSSPFWFLGGGIIYAIFYGIYRTEALIKESWVIEPYSRGIAYLATVVLLTLALNKTKDTLEEIESNIGKIEVILAKLNFLAKGGLGRKLQEKEYKVAKTNLNPKNIQISEVSSEKTICVTGGTVGACPSIANALITSPGFSELPDSMRSLSTSIGKVADSVSGQNVISGSALNAVNALNGKAATINKALNKKAYELNDLINKKGKTKNNLDKLVKGLSQKIKRNAQLAYQKNGGQMNAAVADYMKDSSSLSSVKITDNKNEKADAKKSGASQVGAVAVDTGKGNEFDFDFKEDKTGASGDSAVAGANSTVNLDEYDTGSSEVHPDSKKNIFDIISGRYFKSGYPRLLEEEL